MPGRSPRPWPAECRAAAARAPSATRCPRRTRRSGSRWPGRPARTAARRDSPLTPHRSPLTLQGEGVEPALGLARAAPAPGALGLARGRGAGARPAPDARVTPIEQRVVRDAVLADVAPHVSTAPVREREHFQDRPPGDLVVLEQLRRRPRGGLVLPHGADPGVEGCEGPLEGLDLANPAATVRVRPVEGTGVGERPELDEIETVLLSEPLLEGVRLREMESRVEEEHGNGAVDAADQVREHHAASAEAH